jgi:hypothetical protein
VILPPAAAVNLAAPNGRERAAFPLALQGGTPRPAPCSDASFLATSFFRGRSNNVRNITLNPCEALDWSITRAAQPTNASVQITSLSLGPVAFLLDWSASMKNIDDDGQGNTAPRSEQAAAALQKLVDQQLQAGFVNARKVSLRVFGHRENYSTDGAQQLSPDFDAAFNGFDFPSNESQQQRALGLISMTPLAPAINALHGAGHRSTNPSESASTPTCRLAPDWSLPSPMVSPGTVRPPNPLIRPNATAFPHSCDHSKTSKVACRS